MQKLEMNAAVFATKLVSGFMALLILAVAQSQMDKTGVAQIAICAAFVSLILGAYAVAADRLEFRGSFFKFTAVSHLAAAMIALVALSETLVTGIGIYMAALLLSMQLSLVIIGKMRVRKRGDQT